jgi:DNA-binding NtrC family response regulator
MRFFLIVSEIREAQHSVQECFKLKCRVDRCSDKAAALEILKKKRYDFVFIDLDLLREGPSTKSYREALQPFWHLYPTLQIIVMSSPEKLREAVKAVKQGASNYLTYPLISEEVKLVIESIYESFIAESELEYLRDRFWNQESLEIVQTNSYLMRKVLDKIRSVAATKSTVLLMGETGTGKGLIAKLIHQHSNRKDGSFIAVHCGAIPDTLLESELFGHEKGAFTGAIKRKLGKFEIAKGGTIFLDEIGTITSSAQVKLLQILQDGIFQRVGGEQILEADARIVTATNSDLKQMCDIGQFRTDLFYRLNVFPVEIPPLRERTEDIPHLVEVVLRKLNRLNVKQIRGVHPDVMAAFYRYLWPGNIRELENLIERAFILESTSILLPEAFPNELFLSGTSPATGPDGSVLTFAEAKRRGLGHIERSYLKDVLTRNNGRIKDSAEAAGISTRQLHKLMSKYGIRKEEFKLSSTHATK